MIDNLVQTLPAHRHQALLQELGPLDREIERNFTYPEDLALARIANAQGSEFPRKDRSVPAVRPGR
jgi:hypothetical protein